MSANVLPREFVYLNAEIPDTELTLLTLPDGGEGVLCAGQIAFNSIVMEVSNLGTARALADFQMEMRPHPEAPWSVAITGADWESSSGAIVWRTANINELAKETSAQVLLDVGPFSQIRFSAKAASGGTTSVTVKGRMAVKG